MTALDWHRTIGELGWAIELVVMYQRWCDARDRATRLTGRPDDVLFHKQQWVRMCVRLGDDAAYRIITARPGSATIRGD